MIRAKNIQIVPIKDLKLNPKNRNKHPKEQIERLQKLIEYQGFRNPVIVSNQSGYVVVGHGRVQAAKKLGVKEVPVIYQDFDDEIQEQAYLISDNAIASWAELDLSEINVDIQDMGPDFDIELLGLKDFEIEPADKEDKKVDLNFGFKIEVDCNDELNQDELTRELEARGFKVRVLI